MFPPTDSAKRAFDLFPTTDNVKDINPPRSLQSVEVQESLRIALNKMSRELKGAEVGSIEISADGQKILFSSANVYSGFQFDEDGRELEIDVDESVRESWQPFASNICEVFFQYDPELYFVDIVIKGDGGSGVVQEAATGVCLVVGR
jgi:hypothetical protein